MPVQLRPPAPIRLEPCAREAGDRRVQFVGIKAYKKAGGRILRDLFQPEHDGYLTDAAVLDRLVIEKLEADSEAIRADGWKWVEIMPTINHDHPLLPGRSLARPNMANFACGVFQHNRPLTDLRGWTANRLSWVESRRTLQRGNKAERRHLAVICEAAG